MALAFLNPDEVTHAAYLKLGIYSVNGGGKTHFLSTVDPKLMMLVVSADQENVKPLVGRPNTKVVKISRWADLQDVLAILKSEKNPFKVVAFDTWTRMQELAMNMIIGYEPRTVADIMKYGSQAPKLPKGFENWQQIGALAGEWMGYFCDLPMHNIFLFQEDVKESKEDGARHIDLALTPWALRKAKATLETIGWLYVTQESDGDDLGLGGTDSLRSVNAQRRDKRMLLIGKHDRIFSKGDSAKLGYVVESPDWSKLVAVLG